MTKKRLLEISQLLKAFPQSTEETIKILPQFLQNTAEPDNNKVIYPNLQLNVYFLFLSSDIFPSHFSLKFVTILFCIA